MIWSRIRQHEAQIEMFRRSVQRNRLPHAILLTGAEGIGKRTFALALAQCLLCQRFSNDQLDACGACPSCQSVTAGSHPDLFVVECPEGKRQLPIELFVGSDDKRGREGLCHDLALSPMASDRKIAIIDDADLMNEFSGNALLKTLEEPPRNSVLILVSGNPDQLLDTIRSRCQRVRFSRLTDENPASLLVEQGIVEDQTEAAQIASLAEGSLASARLLLAPELRSLRSVIDSHFSRIPPNAGQLAADILAAVDEIGGNTAAQRSTASTACQFLADFFRAALRIVSGDAAESAVPSVASGFAAQLPGDLEDQLELLMGLIDRVLQADDQLKQNVTAALCLEAMTADVASQLRSHSSAR